MADAARALQAALVAALTTALDPVPVYDDVPPGTATPYVTVGDAVSSGDGDKTRDAQDHAVAIHVFAKGDDRGRKTARTLLADIRAALHESEAALGVTGHRVVMIECESADVARDPDGLLWHGVGRYRILTESE